MYFSRSLDFFDNCRCTRWIWVSSESTPSGKRPSRPSSSRSDSLNAVDLFRCGSRRSAKPCGVFVILQASIVYFRAQLPIQSPEDVGLGKLDEFAAAPAKHRLKHKQAETVCLLEGGLGRHRQFLRVRDYIEQRGTLVGQRSRNRLLQIGRILDADPENADRLCHLREIRILEIYAGGQIAGRFHLEIDETQLGVVEDHHLYRQLHLRERQQIAHQHSEAAITGE